MLNAIIRFALRQQLLVIAFAVFLLGYGTWQALHTTIDVFPDLNRPRVVIMTEAPGLAHDACQELGTDRFRTVNDPDQTRSVLEHVLVMMRGNRSSAFVTYFTAQGEMRFVPRR